MYTYKLWGEQNVPGCLIRDIPDVETVVCPDVVDCSQCWRYWILFVLKWWHLIVHGVEPEILPSHTMMRINQPVCGGQVLGKIGRIVVTHVPTEDLPQWTIYWRILPTNCGYRSNNPRLKRRGDPCWLTRTRSLSSPRSRGGLSPCRKYKE